jgi:hypothetical protein
MYGVLRRFENQILGGDVIVRERAGRLKSVLMARLRPASAAGLPRSA